MDKVRDKRGISILGSTGSIGRQALEVVSLHPKRLEVVALTARASVDILEEQARRYRPRMVGLVSEGAATEMKRRLEGTGMQVHGGESCLMQAATHPDVTIVLNAVVGSAGLPPTLATLEEGKRLALANKESMVAGGDLVLGALDRGGEIVPVDSEHAAIFHCLRGEKMEEVERIILTASGGPFYGWSREELEEITLEDALAHPTWSMGKKITVDSATLMNKGLEVIEAHFLFGMPYDRIRVLAHSQSVVHSLVEFKDGSLSAQLSLPDMRLPIALALSYPERWAPPFARTDMASLGGLSFGSVDTYVFRCLELAYRAGREGGLATVVLNAANEVAVDAFLRGAIGFLDIEKVVETTLERRTPGKMESLEKVMMTEKWARSTAEEIVREVA
ncbi:MAG: 1-deoxy-D-xylulose-5-phosphate reductoisomerase [Actinomycetota bacterium]|nr:1-deoxy-D-xylulose-5-phosphate reductoisomerase [Actinomycetota bacterium]